MSSAFKVIFSILVFWLSAIGCWAQEPGALIDKKEILIGEQATIRLYVPYIKSNPPQVRFPSIGDTLVAGVEVVRLTEPDTVPTSDDVKETRIEQQVVITSFDTGYYAIRPFEFEINGARVVTDAFLFSVRTVEIDTTQGIIDIREIYSVDVTWKDFVALYWPYALGSILGLAAIILGVLLFLRWRRKQREKPTLEPEAPKLPPHQLALEALEHIAKEKRYTRGEIKAYHSEITDALRSYLEGACGIHAHELTSNQIMAGLKYSGVDPAQLRNLRTILFRADMVKFAKEKPETQENERAVLDAIAFVKSVHEMLRASVAPEHSADETSENK